MHVNILGTRGIPAAHGGFETFVAHFAPWMKARGHSVTVYCQGEEEPGRDTWTDDWNGIERIHISPRRSGAVGTMEFDLACVRHVIGRPGVDLVLGYNTAFFNLLQPMRGRRFAINMDGIEWKRAKWGVVAKTWFFLNEIAGANLASAVIVDHPEIGKHVAARSRHAPIMIPYASDVIVDADEGAVRQLGIEPGKFFVSIARIEPENSILELVEAFSGMQTSNKLVVLGKLDPDNEYHRKVKDAAGAGVLFTGAIYDSRVVHALRFFATAYVHGHTVGGTNPSLVEALGAGRPIIAHDNRFNRWTAGDEQFYFASVDEARERMERLSVDEKACELAGAAALRRHDESFTWEKVHTAYEKVLLDLAR